jgi:hypothetical protein
MVDARVQHVNCTENAAAFLVLHRASLQAFTLIATNYGWVLPIIIIFFPFIMIEVPFKLPL